MFICKDKKEKFYLHIGVTYEKNISAKNKTEKQSPRIQTEDEFSSWKKNY